LAADTAVEFTTGQTASGSPTSIELSIDSLLINAGNQYQVVATVRDAAGNTLYEPVTWSTSDSTGLTLRISATGLLTALGPGRYDVIATLNGLSTRAEVRVIGNPTSVTIVPSTASVRAFGTIQLTPEVRNAAGQVLLQIQHPPLIWSSTAQTVATVVDAG